MAAASLNEAMFAAIHSGVELRKDASANYGNYATLGNVMEVLRPVLVENELLVEQAPNTLEGKEVLTTIIIHVPTDQARMYHTPLVLDKSNMQGVGSAITYARRYALVSIFFMDADEDDDGNAAAGSDSAEARVSRKRTASKKEPAEKARAL